MKHSFTRCLICKAPYADVPDGYICRRCAESGKAGKRIEEQAARIKELEAGLSRSEQTVRNLGNGFLTGDEKTIALNESENITKLLGVK